jgi:hypothetical protein
LVGKVCFCVFMFSQTVPGDMALGLVHRQNPNHTKLKNHTFPARQST